MNARIHASAQPPPRFVVWKLGFVGDQDQLKEFFEHVSFFGQDIFKESGFESDGILILRIEIPAGDPTDIVEIFRREQRNIWGELECIIDEEEV